MKFLKSITVSLIMILALMPAIGTHASSNVSVIIDGAKQSYDQPPIIDNGRTLVPLRGIFEELGAKVDWNNSTRTVTATKGSIKVVLKIGSKTPTVNGEKVSLDVPGKIVNSRTMVPLRFVGEALSSLVQWNGSTNTVTILTYDVVLEFPADRYPETGVHIKAAISQGESPICTIDRDGADENREESLKGIPTKDGYDRDEWPMAMCEEGGTGADVAYVISSDNRGAGAWIGNQLEDYPDGTKVLFKVFGAVTPTNPPVSKGNLDITSLNLDAEKVVIKNTGSTDVNMTGWKLVSVDGNQTFDFPSGYVLKAGASVTVTSGRNAVYSPPSILKWTGAYMWDNNGDEAELYNPQGVLVDELIQ